MILFRGMVCKNSPFANQGYILRLQLATITFHAGVFYVRFMSYLIQIHQNTGRYIMSYKASSLSKILLVGAAIAPLWLTACTSDNGPYPMPSGYKHHADTYKAPNGPEMTKIAAAAPAENTMPSPQIQYEEPKVKAAVVPVVEPVMLETEQWQMAADSLIRDMVVHFGLPQLPVFVERGKSIQEQSLAAALENALTDQKIAVSKERSISPYALSYMIINPMDADDTRKMVKIKLSDYDKVIAEESGLFTIGGGGEAMPMDLIAETKPVPMAAQEPEIAMTEPMDMASDETTGDVGDVRMAAEMEDAEDVPVSGLQPTDDPVPAVASSYYQPSDRPLARPRVTAMGERLGTGTMSSRSVDAEDDIVDAPAVYEQDYKETAKDTMDAMQAEEQYQSRIVSMPKGAEDGSATPVPLTSSQDDR